MNNDLPPPPKSKNLYFSKTFSFDVCLLSWNKDGRLQDIINPCYFESIRECKTCSKYYCSLCSESHTMEVQERSEVEKTKSVKKGENSKEKEEKKMGKKGENATNEELKEDSHDLFDSTISASEFCTCEKCKSKLKKNERKTIPWKHLCWKVTLFPPLFLL